MGKEMYTLHDNGRKLFTSARDCTPMQRFVYVMARNHHEEDQKSNHQQNVGGMKEAQRFNKATSWNSP